MASGQSLKTVRIFVSSPGDVAEERTKAREIFDRLQGEFSGALEVLPYFWEHEPLLAHTDPQSQIEPPSTFDLFVCLLWARLGTRLHPGLHRKPDGSGYASGTEQELLDALEGFHKSGAPEVIIYRRNGEPPIPTSPKGAGERVLNQFYALQTFIANLTEKDGYFVATTNSYKGLDQFEAKFEGDMRKVLRRYVPDGVSGARNVPKTWENGTPFRGLRHFDFEHAPIFFGRTRDIGDILEALRRQAADERAFVLVFGGSGVGKSSLIRAGVLPWLVKPGVIDGVGLWRRAILRPSEGNEGDLFDSLALALWHKDALPELGSDGTTAAQLAKMLREAPEGVGMLIKGVLSQVARDTQLADKLATQPRALFALVVDQLEELFTVERLSGQREGFLRALDALARSGYVYVMATLRSDFYARCEESPLLMELKKDAGQYHLRPPDEMQLGQMIRLPAAAAGLSFEEDYDSGQRLDDVLRDAALASPSSLPLLEFALEELYLKRDPKRGLLLLEAYKAMGGVEGALGERAEESFTQTSAAAQERFAHVFRKLVTINSKGVAISPDGDEPAVRRRARKDEIATDAGSRELIDRLVADRLLVADRTEDDIVVVSVAHEAMLTRWPRLKAWIASHRETLKNHAEVTADTQRWLEKRRNDDYLCHQGLPVNKAKDLLEAGFLSRDEEEFVRASLKYVAGKQFQETLETGEGMQELSTRLREDYPEVRQRLLSAALTASGEATRSHAALLLGTDPVEPLTHELVSLLLNDREDEVRRAAAASLVQLDHAPYFEELAGQLRDGSRWEVIRAFSYLRVAADARREATSFEPRMRALAHWLRWRITARAWAQRLKRGFPILVIVLMPAMVLSCVSAGAFKFFPGLLNYAFSQAHASGPAALFQGVLAAVVWGGFITFSIITHSVVFGNERGRKSLLQPWGALVAGAVGGVISSLLVIAVVVVVSDSSSVIAVGWTTLKREDGFELYLLDTMFTRRCFWPYLIMGVGLSLGMALMTNGLRASQEWRAFLGRQSHLTDLKSTLGLVRALSKLSLRFSWPIPLCLLIADVISFRVLRGAHAPAPLLSGTLTDMLLGGRNEGIRLAWKMSPWGQGLGIFFDSATQGIGGFFAIVGMGLGIIAIRYGVKIEPRRN